MSRTKTNKEKYKADKVILSFAVAMAIFGAIMIFDASVYKANELHNDPFHFLKLQAIWLLIGFIPALIIYFWDYRKLLKLSFPILILTVLLLIAVLIFAEEINGSKRWFSFGSLPPIQPAEFAKLSIILYLSRWLGNNKIFSTSIKSDFKNVFLKSLISFGIIISLVIIPIFLEPDLGTTIIIAVTTFIMFFLAKDDKNHKKYSLLLILLFIPFLVIAAVIEPYRMKRITTFLHLLFTGEVTDPQQTGYQIQQILIGIGSGGIFGTGFGQSRQRFGYLVENTAFTDSIFAVILEEMGFLGGTILVIAWIAFLWRGLKIAKNAPDKQGSMLAVGITVWLTIQAFVNMAANVGLMPLTGIPLPFLTYGGSSTIVTLVGIGILLNISKYNNQNQNGKYSR
ncbi:MAG: FtsW/RodA/SpoVE family cell cycle protein [Candidatus Dojkabacteria bacterium]|jgi:cell division protein FtsW